MAPLKILTICFLLTFHLFFWSHILQSRVDDFLIATWSLVSWFSSRCKILYLESKHTFKEMKMLRNKHQEDWSLGSDPSSDPGSNTGSDPGSDPGFTISLSQSDQLVISVFY